MLRRPRRTSTRSCGTPSTSHRAATSRIRPKTTGARTVRKSPGWTSTCTSGAERHRTVSLAHVCGVRFPGCSSDTWSRLSYSLIVAKLMYGRELEPHGLIRTYIYQVGIELGYLYM